MRRRIPRVVLGLFLIGAGVACVGRALHLWYFDPFFEGWWTLFLLVPAACSMASNGINGGNLTLALVGVLFLLEEQEVLQDVQIWPLAVALLLVWGGIRLLFPRNPQTRQSTYHPSEGGYDFQDHPHYQMVLGSNWIKNACKSLKDGSCRVVLGSMDVDFTQAELEGDASLQVSAILGRLTLHLPKGVNPNLQESSILGRCSNGVNRPFDPCGHLLQVRSTAVLGTVKILSD